MHLRSRFPFGRGRRGAAREERDTSSRASSRLVSPRLGLLSAEVFGRLRRRRGAAAAAAAAAAAGGSGPRELRHTSSRGGRTGEEEGASTDSAAPVASRATTSSASEQGTRQLLSCCRLLAQPFASSRLGRGKGVLRQPACLRAWRGIHLSEVPCSPPRERLAKQTMTSAVCIGFLIVYGIVLVSQKVLCNG
ncbi:uncharacterized protein LOC134773406 [Penaeus indicus]|uniref:uncharacterized protein LOC134773406 n=1 Tax=Penaeus indicus TaxID=29960 RepID=UPI00300C3D3E